MKWDYYVPGALDLLVLGVWFFFGIAAASFVNLGLARILPPERALETGLLLSYPLMFIPAMLYASVRSRHRAVLMSGVRLESAHFAPMGGFAACLAASVATLALGYCAEAPARLLPPMPDNLREMMERMTSGSLVINFLCVSVLAPLCEEWLCRGMVLRGLLHHKVAPVWAVTISALAFAAIRANLWQAIPAFIMGLLFGYVYYRTGSLRLSMLMHSVNNTFALAIGHIDALKDCETWADVLAPRPYWIVFAACAMVVTLSFLAFRKIPLEGRNDNMDEIKPLFTE